MTRDERRVLKMAVPQTDDQLWAWIAVVCGFKIPRRAVCEHHCSPFAWIADAYFDRVQKMIVMANRGGGKTLGAACLSYAELLHRPGVEVASVGAIMKQAQKMYRYMKGFLREDQETGLCYPPTMAHTDFANRARLEIITGKTAEAVNSPHPHRVNIDEYELMVWAILEEALLMPIQTETIPYSVRLLSTRKFPMGNVQSMLNQAEERGYRVYPYCALDCAEQCTFEARPSCDPCKEVVKYDQHGQPVTWYDVCRERLRNACGFLSVDKLIEDFRGLNVETYLTQVAPCRRPTRGNACFTEFIEEVHAAERIEYDPDFPIGTGWDYGLNDPTVCTVWQWDAAGEVWCIDVIASGEAATSPAMRDALIADVGAELLKRPYAAAILESREHWGDPAGKQRRTYTRVDTKSAVDVLRGMGIHVRSKKKPNPARRIESMKLKLRPSEAMDGQPAMYVSSACRLLIDAFTFAQWQENREHYEHDIHSHVLDSAGYFIDALWPPKSYYPRPAVACH